MALLVGVRSQPAEPAAATGPIDGTGEWIVDLTGDVTDICRLTILQTPNDPPSADLTGSGNCVTLPPFTLVAPSTINQTTGYFTITTSTGVTLYGLVSKDSNSADGDWVAGPASGTFTAARVIDISGSWAASYTVTDPAPPYASTCSLSPEAIADGGIVQAFTKAETAGVTADGMCGLAALHLSGVINQKTGAFGLDGEIGLLPLQSSGAAAKGGGTAGGVWSTDVNSGTFAAARIADTTSSAIVAAAGGSIDTGSGDPVEAELTIAPGALKADTTVTLEVWSSSAAPDLDTFLPGVPAASGVEHTAGFVLNFLPEGTTLNPPFAEITVTYTDAAVQGVDEYALGIIHFTGSQWVSADILERDTVGNTIRARIESFSLWGPYSPGVDDTDSDGCDDAAELGSNQNVGGGRDPLFFWDFFDANRDGAVGAGDFFGVLSRFGAESDPPLTKQEALLQALEPPPPPPAYHASHDRTSPAPGADPWDTGPPEGAIAAGDFFAVLAQFGHDCQ